MTAPTKTANFTVTHDGKRTVTVHQESVDFDPVAPVVSFGVGLLEVGAGVYLSQYSDVIGNGFSTIVPYLLMLGVLFVRPHGLFGTVEIRRV